MISDFSNNRIQCGQGPGITTGGNETKIGKRGAMESAYIDT